MYSTDHILTSYQITKNPVADEPQNDVQIGIVTNCTKLNIRKEPNPNSAILCVVANKAELMVEKNESTEEFYKVCTAAGIEGFCMRKFVTI